MVLEAEQLPDELILEILSRLPSESLASCMIQRMLHARKQLVKLWEPGVFFNRGVQWIGEENDSWIVICFDVEEKLFREVPRPDCVDKWAYIMVGVLGEQLCMLSKYDTDIEIWVMSDSGKKDSWTKLFSVDDTIMRYARNFCHSCIDYNEQYPSPLCFANHGEILLKDGKDLLLYDPEKKSAKSIKIHGIMDWSDSYPVVTYVPSLVSLQSGTYMGTGQEVDGEVKQYLRDGVLRLRS